MSTETAPIIAPKDVPAVKQARAVADAAARQLHDAQARVTRYTALLAPTDAPVDALDRLEAEAHIAAVRVEVARLERDYVAAQRTVEQARDAAREQVRAAFTEREREALTAFRDALIACRATNEQVKAAQFARHEALNEPFDPLSWAEFSFRLDRWLEAVEPLLTRNNSAQDRRRRSSADSPSWQRRRR